MPDEVNIKVFRERLTLDFGRFSVPLPWHEIVAGYDVNGSGFESRGPGTPLEGLMDVIRSAQLNLSGKVSSISATLDVEPAALPLMRDTLTLYAQTENASISYN